MDKIQTLGWADGVTRPLEDARNALLEAGKEARHVIGEVGETIGPLRGTLEQTIAAHPLKALMFALAAGVLLGWWIKRS